MAPDVPEGWRSIRLGDVCRPARIPVEVDGSESYTEIGVRSFGRGVFVKPPATGESIGNKRVFRVVPDSLIANIVFAWEGAIAKTTSEHDGLIASHRFPMWQPAKLQADLDYLLYFFNTREGVTAAGKASPGGAGRNRTLNQTVFLDTKIPIPPRRWTRPSRRPRRSSSRPGR